LRRSTQYLIEFNKSFMFNEIESPDADEAPQAAKEEAGASSAMETS
jgi:hypothetical protein